jgi:hypothetical protein
MVSPVASTISLDSISASAASPSIQKIDSATADQFQKALHSIKPSSTKARDVGLFLTTNEKNQEKTLATLHKHPLVGEVMLFVSGFWGLNAAAARGPAKGQKIQYLICLDVCHRVQAFWNHMQVIITKGNSKEEVTGNVIALIQAKHDAFYPINSQFVANQYILALKQEIETGVSWLSSDERFRVIKHIFDANHFVFKGIDVCDQDAMLALSKSVSDLGLRFDCIYLSNIREYAEYEQRLQEFHEGIKCLKSSTSDQTLFIDTKPKQAKQDGLVQRVMRKIPNSDFNITFPPTPYLQQTLNNSSVLLSNLFSQLVKASLLGQVDVTDIKFCSIAI